jgi:type II secretory pathway component PulF
VLWSVRLIYGARRGVSDDTLQRVFLLTGWLLLLGGITGTLLVAIGPLALLLVVPVVLIVGAYLKYRAAEHRALLWALAVAAEEGIPLAQAARAFAIERSVQLGARTSRLADFLEAGSPLPQALALSRNPVAAEALLAARIGQATGQLGPALRMALQHGDYLARTMRGSMAVLSYLCILMGVAVWVVAFIMLKIVPVFMKMFDEFGLRLPALTQLVVAASAFVVNCWFILMWPAVFGFASAVLLVTAYYAGWSRYEIPFFHRFWRRRETALLLRTLAFAVRLQQPWGATLTMLAAEYPKASVAARLAQAAAAIERGVPWCDALVVAGVLPRTEAAVLRAAERAGNLAWALDEMADSTMRRFAWRFQASLGVLFPIVIVVFGLAVGTFVIGLFLPLVSLIQGLA